MIDTIINYSVNFFQQYTILAVVIVLVLLFAAYRKPKESFKFLVLLIIVGCILYAIDMFGESTEQGSKSKNEAIYKTKKILDD